jgi:hypothetical protein
MRSVLIGLLIAPSSCSITKPEYAIPAPPVEKPSCADVIMPLKEAGEACVNIAVPALSCMYSREAASDAYVEVLQNALKQVNK